MTNDTAFGVPKSLRDENEENEERALDTDILKREEDNGGLSKGDEGGGGLTDEEVGLFRALIRSRKKPKFDYTDESIEADDKSEHSADTETREQTVKVNLNPDTFSFLVVSPFFSFPFFTGIFIICMKVAIFSLIMAGLIDTSDLENPLQIPTSVDGPVVVAQFLALLITVVTQDDLLSAMHLMGQTGQLENLRRVFPEVTHFKWFLACTIMFLNGVLGLVVTFALVVVSPDVVELMLNFTAVEFVGLLDNIGFGLAQQGLLGKANRTVAESIEETEYRIPKSKELTPKKLIAIMIVMYFGLIAGWGVIYYNQLSGAYTPNTLVVQFDDEVLLSIGTYSGIYVLNNNPFAVGFNRIRYENVDGDGVFAYCTEQGVWTFTLDKTANKPCEKVLVRSSQSVSFDITDSAGDQWFVTASVDTARFFPMDVFHMGLGCEEDPDCGGVGRGECNDDNRCVCNDGFYGINCDFVREKTCPKLELDPESLRQQTEKQYPMRYATLLDEEDKPIEVYNRHVFVSDFAQNTNVHVILFAGLRWILSPIPGNITDIPSLRNFFRQPQAVAAQSLLESSEFLASETLRVNSPADTPEPLDLVWSPVEGMSLLPSVSVDLFCATCNNETNPCRFGNTCPASGICDCTNGATGTLCDNAPLGDGECHNVFFNVGSLKFDGGDCCEITCKNTGGNVCGVTSVNNIGNLYTGFPDCADGSDDCKAGEESCYVFKSESILSISRFNEARVTLAGNGRTMAIAEPSLDTVRIFDQSDANWVQRGSSLEGIRRSLFGRLVAFSRFPSEILRRINGKLPYVVAVAFGRTGEGDIRIMGNFDGSSDWTQIGRDVELCRSPGCDVLSIDVTTRNDLITVAGGALLDGGTVTVHSTTVQAESWELLMTVSGSRVTLSADGDILAVADNQIITRYDLRKDMNATNETIPFQPSILSTHDLSAFGERAEIMGIKMDKDGQEMTAYLHRTNQVFSLVRFGVGARRPKPHPGTLLEFDNVFDPPIIDFSDDGSFVTSTRDLPNQGRIVRALRYDAPSMSWKEVGNNIPVSSRAEEFALSHDAETVVIGGDSPTEIYTLSDECDGTRVRLSFSMDDDPPEISWYAETSQYLGDIKLPTKTFTQACDHCYDDELFRTMASQTQCIPLDECLEFSFEKDKKFDGGFGFVFFVNGTETGELGSNFSGGNNFSTEIHARESCTLESMVCEEGMSLLTMIFDLDGHPQETNWTLRNSSQDLLFSESNYAEIGRDIRQYCVQSNECFSLTIEDADGFHASSGTGGYRIYLDGTLLVERNANFSITERAIFGNCETRVFGLVEAEITFSFDPFFGTPNETSYSITDLFGRQVASGGPFLELEDLRLQEEDPDPPIILPCEAGKPEFNETSEGIVVDGVSFDQLFVTMLNETYLGGSYVNATVVDADFVGSVFVDSTVLDGAFVNSTFRGGTISGGIFEDCLFVTVEILDGTFSNSSFVDSIFLGGTISNGIFYNSSIENGTFIEGTFILEPPPAPSPDLDFSLLNGSLVEPLIDLNASVGVINSSSTFNNTEIIDFVSNSTNTTNQTNSPPSLEELFPEAVSSIFNSTVVYEMFDEATLYDEDDFIFPRFNLTQANPSLEEVFGLDALADLWPCNEDMLNVTMNATINGTFNISNDNFTLAPSMTPSAVPSLIPSMIPSESPSLAPSMISDFVSENLTTFFNESLFLNASLNATEEFIDPDPFGLCESNLESTFDICGSVFTYSELFAFFNETLDFVELFGNETAVNFTNPPQPDPIVQTSTFMIFPDEVYTLVVKDTSESGIRATYTVTTSAGVKQEVVLGRFGDTGVDQTDLFFIRTKEDPSNNTSSQSA